MPDRSSALERSVEILRGANAVVVSTGAGMSKESGIPTFRDAPNALWAEFDPERLASPAGFRRDPALVWRWYGERRDMIAEAEPNAGHRAIAELERKFENFVVLTQNIDNLHRRAGSKNVVEVHGNIFRYKCFDNNHRVDELPADDHVPPRCKCGSLLRPDVVWFGELLPARALDQCFDALQKCDVIVVVGTSGMVHPAAGFPAVAKETGALVIEVNPEETPITAGADVFVQGPAGEVLPEIARGLV